MLQHIYYNGLYLSYLVGRYFTFITTIFNVYVMMFNHLYINSMILMCKSLTFIVIHKIKNIGKPMINGKLKTKYHIFLKLFMIISYIIRLCERIMLIPLPKCRFAYILWHDNKSLEINLLRLFEHEGIYPKQTVQTIFFWKGRHTGKFLRMGGKLDWYILIVLNIC